MNFGRAFLAGVVGGLVMTILMWIARLTGLTDLNLEMVTGSMLTRETGQTTWVIGIIAHLVISGLIACLYALGFEYLTHRANWVIGLGFAIIHTLIAGVAVGMMERMHPLMVDGEMRAPGLFAANYGEVAMAGFIILHLLFGAIVGAIYRVTAQHYHRGVPHPA